MKRLTRIGHWDKVHSYEKNSHLQKIADRLNKTRYFKSYTFSAFDRLCQQYLPKNPMLKILEVGSAPGRRLIYMHRMFGYEPYGVEYSFEGVDQNRVNFINNNLNPENVIHADFFDPSFHELHKSSFDIVTSFGFIEHFDDPVKVIRLHLKLLKTSGLLLITVPNLRGFNYYIQSFLNRGVLKKCNLEIMQIETFRSLFEIVATEEVYCGYYGTFNFASFSVDYDSMIKYAKYPLLFVQLVMNPAMHLFFRKKGFNSRYWSPYLVYIGRKK